MVRNELIEATRAFPGIEIPSANRRSQVVMVCLRSYVKSSVECSYGSRDHMTVRHFQCVLSAYKARLRVCRNKPHPRQALQLPDGLVDIESVKEAIAVS